MIRPATLRGAEAPTARRPIDIRARCLVPGLLLIACLSASPVARGEEGLACETVVVLDEHGPLDSSWRTAAASLREEFARRRDCVAATITITPALGGARLDVATENGARAQRFVQRPSSLRAIALGVATTIPREHPTDADAPTPSELPPVDPAPAPPRVAPTPAPVRLDASAMAGVRLGMPTRVLAADAEARVDVLVDDWFLVARVRYAPLGGRVGGVSIPGYTYDEIALGLGFGRRWRLGSAILDVDLGPAIVIMTEEGDIPEDGTGGTADELRLTLGARAAFGAGRLHPAVGFDTEAAPFALTRPAQADPQLPPLPTWCVSLRAGVLGDLL